MTRWFGLAVALNCCGVALAAAWTPAGPWGGGATAITIHAQRPAEMLAGARGSLVYYSADAGAHWRRLAFPRHFSGTVTSLWFDPAAPGRYLAGIDANGSPFSGLWVSEDAGASWKQSAELAGSPVYALTTWRGGSNVLAAGTGQGVWRSTDRGRRWTRISRPWLHEMRVVTAVAFAPDDARVLYAGTPHLPWKTVDAGEHWESIHEGLIDDSDIFSIDVDPRKPTRVLLSACSGIYRTDTGGAPWTKFRGIPPELRRTHVVHADGGHGEAIYAGTTVGLLKSTDGVSFVRLNELPILGAAFDAKEPGHFYLAAEGSGLWGTRDGGKTLHALNEGFTSRRVGQLTKAGNRLYLTTLQDGDGGGLFASDDQGTSWTLAADMRALDGQHFQFLAGNPREPLTLAVGNTDRLRRSIDGGKSWRDIAVPFHARLQALAAVDGAKGVVLLAGTNRGLARSSDFGRTWTPVSLTTVKIVPSVQGLTVAGARVLARTGEGLYLSNDAGATWKPLSLLLATSLIYDIALSPRNYEETLLATAQGLWRSVSGTSRWERVGRGLEDGTVASVAWDPQRAGHAWCVQFGRLKESADGGLSWVNVKDGAIPDASVRKLWASGDRLYAVTPDLGIFYRGR
jgi:photosystem II stability/assembly factor-like uncharacterized protein